MPEEAGVRSSPTDRRPSPPSVTPELADLSPEWQEVVRVCLLPSPVAVRLAQDLGGGVPQWDTIVAKYSEEHRALDPSDADVEVALRRWWAVDARWCRDRVEDRDDEASSPLWPSSTSQPHRNIGSHQGIWVREALLDLVGGGWDLSRILVSALCVLEGP